MEQFKTENLYLHHMIRKNEKLLFEVSKSRNKQN